MAGQSDEETHDRPFKRMRKGTKSCLDCRRRKAKCIYIPSDSSICTECTKRNWDCVPQGIVEELDTSHNRRLKLKERVDQLQSLVEQLVPDNKETAGVTKNDSLERALEGILPGISNAVTLSTERESRNAAGLHAEVCDHDEELFEGSTAPLVRLLNNPVLGTTPMTSSKIASADHTPGTDGPRLQQQHSRRQEAHLDALREMYSTLPSKPEMNEVFDRSNWWLLWRETLDIKWGGEDSTTLRAFADVTLASGDPCLLGILLVGFAITTGDLKRYLPPVEKHILHNNRLASTVDGLSCLMCLGMCYMNNLMPRRTWMVFSRATTLLQLNGIHLTHQKSPTMDAIFWHLLHADRWVSNMIGLPYLLADRFCDVSIPPLGEMPTALWLYRQLTLITGRVTDCLQDTQGPSLSAALRMEEELDDILAQLPPMYLDTDSIKKCLEMKERCTRFTRALHVYQIRAYVHIPLMLRAAGSERYDYSLKTCVNNARRLLEAYLALHDMMPSATDDGCVINFVAFIMAVILLLGVMGYGRRTGPGCNVCETQDNEDWCKVSRTIDAMKAGMGSSASRLCEQCSIALESLAQSARCPNVGSAKTVVLPYFGTVSIVCATQQSAAVPMAIARGTSTLSHDGRQNHPAVDSKYRHPQQRPVVDGNAAGAIDGVSLDYQGPYLFDWGANNWLLNNSDGTAGFLVNGNADADPYALDVDWNIMGDFLLPEART